MSANSFRILLGTLAVVLGAMTPDSTLAIPESTQRVTTLAVLDSLREDPLALTVNTDLRLFLVLELREPQVNELMTNRILFVEAPIEALLSYAQETTISAFLENGEPLELTFLGTLPLGEGRLDHYRRVEAWELKHSQLKNELQEISAEIPNVDSDPARQLKLLAQLRALESLAKQLSAEATRLFSEDDQDYYTLWLLEEGFQEIEVNMPSGQVSWWRQLRFGRDPDPPPPFWHEHPSITNVQKYELAAAGPTIRMQKSTLLKSIYHQELDSELEAAFESLEPGLIAYNPKLTMVQGLWEEVRVRIARTEEAEISEGFPSHEPLLVEEIRRSGRMTAVLRFKPGSFEVQPVYSAEQAITPPYTDWIWNVRPLRSGLHQLYVVVEPVITLSNGDRTTKAFRKDAEISVTVNPSYVHKQFIKTNWQWLATVLLIPLVVATCKALRRRFERRRRAGFRP